MDGLEQHLRFQVKIAGGGGAGMDGGDGMNSKSDIAMGGGLDDEDLPDIASMIPIERVKI